MPWPKAEITRAEGLWKRLGDLVNELQHRAAIGVLDTVDDAGGRSRLADDLNEGAAVILNQLVEFHP